MTDQQDVFQNFFTVCKFKYPIIETFCGFYRIVYSMIAWNDQVKHCFAVPCISTSIGYYLDISNDNYLIACIDKIRPYLRKTSQKFGDVSNI